MNQLQRYTPERPVYMALLGDGQWVRFTDHQKVVKQLEDSLEKAANVADELRAANEEQLAALRKELVDAARRNANLLRQLPEEQGNESDSSACAEADNHGASGV